MSQRTRSAAVAGLFYPSDPGQLRSDLDEMMAAADAPSLEGPKALIVPHAGYVYSGPVAAQAYAHLPSMREDIRRVVLIGPCHRVPLRGLGLSSATAFETPLGSIPLDRAGAEALANFDEVVVSDAAHAQEHSLEVQLPFLQTLLGDFELLPIACGHASSAAVAAVMEWALEQPHTLLLLSTDLSHFHGYEEGRRLDESTARAIEAADGEAIDPDGACGAYPLRGLLRVAKERGLSPVRLDLRSSGDTAGDKSRVVGYGAWALV